MRVSRALSHGILLVVWVAVLSCAGPEPRFPGEAQAARGPCDDFDKDVERHWSKSTRIEVRAGILSVTGDYAHTLVERVVTKMDHITRDWVLMQESVCKDTIVRKITPPEVYTKVAACMRVALVSQRTLVEAMRSPNKEQVFKLDEAVLTIGRDNAECQKEAIYSAYAPRESDRVAIEAAREGRAGTAPLRTGRMGTSDLDVAQQALGEARAYARVADRAKWAEAVERGIAAARRAKEPKVLVDLLLSDSGRLIHLEAKYDAAMARSREAQELAEETRYEEGRGESYHNIGLVHAQLGRYPEALGWYQKAIAIREKVFGKDHPITAATYGNIAIVYHSQGKYPEALEWFWKDLAITEKVLGKDHPDTAASYNNIAVVYDDQGKYPEALELHHKALAITEKVLGKDHPDTATSYTNVADLYATRGEYREALELYQRALAVKEKVLGKDHPSAADSYLRIGSVYDSQGKYPEALEWHHKALAIFEKVFGKDHPSTATSYNNIAVVYEDQGRYREALELYQRALAIKEKVLGKDHPDTAWSYKRLGLLCTDQRHQPACDFLKQHPHR